MVVSKNTCYYNLSFIYYFKNALILYINYSCVKFHNSPCTQFFKKGYREQDNKKGKRVKIIKFLYKIPKKCVDVMIGDKYMMRT